MRSWVKEKERKDTSERKKEKKKIRAFATPRLALHAFPPFQYSIDPMLKWLPIKNYFVCI